MADTDDRETATPMTDAEVVPPPADATFTPAAPLKDAGVSFEAEDGSAAPGTAQTIKDGAASLKGQAADKARLYAEDGKAKALGALGQFSSLLNEAAGQVDERLGEQYGQYARSAADRVNALSSSIDAKDIDELLDDARALVRKSPAVAIGVAAGIGFVVARLLAAGVDQRDA